MAKNIHISDVVAKDKGQMKDFDPADELRRGEQGKAVKEAIKQLEDPKLHGFTLVTVRHKNKDEFQTSISGAGYLAPEEQIAMAGALDEATTRAIDGVQKVMEEVSRLAEESDGRDD